MKLLKNLARIEKLRELKEKARKKLEEIREKKYTKKDYIPLLISIIFVALFVLRNGFKTNMSIGFMIGALSVGIISTIILEIEK